MRFLRSPSMSELMLEADARRESRGVFELVLERGETGPTGVEALLVVDVRLDVEVAPALRAQPRAVGLVENLLRQRQHEAVARPRREVEALVGEVRRLQLLVIAGI